MQQRKVGGSDTQKRILENILDERMLLVGMVLSHREGPGALKSLLRGKLPLRVDVLDLVAALAFIETKANEGALDKQNWEQKGGVGSNTEGFAGRQVKWKIREKYKSIFIDPVFDGPNKPANRKATSLIKVNKMNGEAFHVVMVASLLSQGKPVTGIESPTGIKFKKTDATGNPKVFATLLERRVDIVVGNNPDEVTWYEVKSVAFKTKRKGAALPKTYTYTKAMCSFDVENITHQCDVNDKNDKDATLVVRGGQFYTKEFFVDRAYAGDEIQLLSNKMRWVFHDFKAEMPAYSGNGSKLKITDEKYDQCGVNKNAGGGCASIYGSVNPLDVSREKLAKKGIRSSNKMHDVVFRTIELDSLDDVPGYLDGFYGERNKIITSENAFDWLASNAAHQLSAICEVD